MTLTLAHTDLATAVTTALRAAIVSGELAPGSRLVENDLATQFGVSRGPIRDALVELQHTGLVELHARKGSFVASLTSRDVLEIYSLRTALESLAVRQAVAIGVDAERLRGLLAELDDAHGTGNSRKIGAADMALHRAIVESAGNERLLAAWERLADQTLLILTNLSALDPEIQGPTGSHRLVVDRLIHGDAELAVAALTQHLDEARDVVTEQLSE